MKIEYLLPHSASSQAVRLLAIIYLTVVVSAGALAHDAEGVEQTKIVPLMLKGLTGIEGKEASMITVEYAPGASTPNHRHNADVFVYVLEGHVTMQAAGGELVTVGPGQTFYESPADIHAVSKNASDVESAKFLVFMVKDMGTPSVIPVAQP